jgi:hypothetical protein
MSIDHVNCTDATSETPAANVSLDKAIGRWGLALLCCASLGIAVVTFGFIGLGFWAAVHGAH